MAERNLGLVPIADPSSFDWAGKVDRGCRRFGMADALVYVTAVPYNMFSVPPEAQTGSDGWAELRMNRLRGYPATPRQQLLVMFVRAREPGGNLLGGISTHGSSRSPST